MSHPLTKYVAAGALAGAVAFGGFTLAGAQDGGSTTTTPPATKTFCPSTQPRPIVAPAMTWQKCQICVPSPMEQG